VNGGLLIASVTTTLRNSLADWLAANPGGLLSRQVEISTLPPTRDVSGRAGGPVIAHLYLRSVAPRRDLHQAPGGAAGAHDAASADRDRFDGIELGYLVGVMPIQELDTEIVLGAALDWIRNSPVMTLEAVAPVTGAAVDSWRLRVLLEELSTEEMAAMSRAVEGACRVHVAIRVQLVR